MQNSRLTFLIRLALAALATGAGLSSVHAEDASPWATDSHSQVRLIAGSNAPGEATLRAGLDIKLAPGWKTYWRYPGDSGVPPRFDFAASSNVKAVEVLWPAPERIVDGGGQSIGYHARVIMPLRITPADPARPVLLQLKLSYAICEKLCVPAEAVTRLEIGPGKSDHDTDLTAAEGRVPKPAKIGAGDALAVKAVHRYGSGKRQRVSVDVAAPSDGPVDLFAEGPTTEWALPLPEPKASGTAETRQFSFELDGVPRGTEPKGAELTLTLVAGAQAIEVKAPLD